MDCATILSLQHVLSADEAVYPSSLWGPSLDHLDQVVERCLLPELSVGDWLLFSNMGAYSLDDITYLSSASQLPVYYTVSTTDWWVWGKAVHEGPRLMCVAHQDVLFTVSWPSCLMLPTGMKCRRLVWHWTVLWRISLWSIKAQNSPRPLSWIIWPRRSSTSAYAIWPEGKCGQHSSHPGKKLGHIASSRKYLLTRGKQFGCLIPQLSNIWIIWKIVFQVLRLPLMDSKHLSAERPPAQTQMILCNKMDDSPEMGPLTCWGGLFPTSNPVYKMYNWFKSCSLLITCCVKSVSVQQT